MVGRALREWGQGFIHLFYPDLCEGCSKPLVQGEDVLCLPCALELPETGYHDFPENETVMRFAGRFPFRHATTYAYFTVDGLLQHLLHRLKYQGRKEVGVFLGRMFAQSLAGCQWIPTVDAIVPVPLHRRRLQERGYNQSALIAQAMGKQLGIPVVEDGLLRTRKTESQTRKTRTERLKNMENAFSLNPAALAGYPHVLLLDDVLTTGATLEACALALLEHPGTEVSIATIGLAV